MSVVRLISFVLLALTFAPAVASAGGKDNPPGKSGKAVELKKLLEERRDTLGKLVLVLQEQYKAGQVDFAKVFHAEMDALRATLDLSDSPQERIKVLQQHQRIAANMVAVIDARFQVGNSTFADKLQGQALLLQVRIELVREELKVEAQK